MKFSVFLSCFFCVCGGAIFAAENNTAGDYPRQPVALRDVRITGRFWLPRFETNRIVTVWTDFKRCEETGRIKNFDVAAGVIPGTHAGIPYDDSDVYKVIEGAALTLAQHPDEKLDAYLDALIAKIAAAQESDGYLHTARTIYERNLKNDPDFKVAWANMLGERRWANVRDGHELYNVGHLYEAAVAHFDATGKRALLDVALKNADLICRDFGNDTGQIRIAPGHEEIEIGLVKLYRATGEKRYLAQAKFFIETRGDVSARKSFGANYQDHAPLLAQKEAVGHAVRAGYFYAGATDVAALTNDNDTARALDVLWENVVGKKMHITGGIGARHAGEAFGDDYELPNETAYLETCAAIANALWNERMFLLHGDSKYADIIERVLYNGFLSGVSLSGDEFFYPNPLASRGGYARSKWFGTSCCPTNDVRFIPQIGQFAYAKQDARPGGYAPEIYVNLFLESTAKFDLGNDTGVISLEQKTNYPWDGAIKIFVTPENDTARFALKIRVPGWAHDRPVPGDLYSFAQTEKEKAEHNKMLAHVRHSGVGIPAEFSNVVIKINGEGGHFAPQISSDGYVTLYRHWEKNDTVEVTLKMPVRRVRTNDAVAGNKNLLAVERGPLVYCLETADNTASVYSLAIDANAQFSQGKTKILDHEVVTLTAPAKVAPPKFGGKILNKNDTAGNDTATLIPYYAWCHRGADAMRVWLPVNAADAERNAVKTTASYLRANGTDVLSAASDGILPENSNDQKIPRWTCWEHKGGEEWLRYDFEKPQKFNGTAVYWFDDTGAGECRIPAAWRVQFLDENNVWRDAPVAKNTAGYPVFKDKFSPAKFSSTVTAKSFRLIFTCRQNFAAGVLEWQLE